MSAPDPVIEQLDQALDAAGGQEPWPDQLQIRDAIEELSNWLDDERQWARARPHNWSSLIDDAVGALRHLGPEVAKATESSGFCGQLKECRALLKDKTTRSDPALRRRLQRIVGAIREQFHRDGVLVAAWADLTRNAGDRDVAEHSARQLLSLAGWIGHDPEGLRRALQSHLTGRVAGAQAQPVPVAPERLAATEGALKAAPRRAHMVVWLRFIFARVPDRWIDVGPAVRIYNGDWLRSGLGAAAPPDDLPPEASNDELSSLETFCQARDDLPDERERPVAYIRIDVGDELVSEAVRVARDTAQAIAWLGVLYGAEPTLWRLDESHVCYADGHPGSALSAPPVVEGPTFQERVAVPRDRTAEGLEELAERLGAHLPVRDPGLHEAATLLGWLREARAAPAPVRMVLFDRVVEAACGWAGIQSASRFVRDSLIPWWAYSRIYHAIRHAGFAAAWDDFDLLGAGPAHLEAREEIRRHPPLELSGGDRRQVNLRGVLTETRWLLERVPESSNAARQLSKLAERTATGHATSKWWDRLCEHGRRIEARRLRTRNSLVHGGPLAPATVESVVMFAEHLAGEALAACVEARLRGDDLVEYFLNRDDRLTGIRAQLNAGANPPDVLFWND